MGAFVFSQVNGRRSVSPVKTESAAVRKNSSPTRKVEQEDGNSISTPLRAAAPEPAPQPQLTKQPSTGKLDKGKFANFQREDSSSSVVSIKRKTSTESESEYSIF
jgi:hypothetical protein